MTTFEHGTLTGAKHHHCKCAPCRAANRRYENRRTRLIAYGQWQPLVDAQPVRDHVNKLRAAGLGPKRIVALSDVSIGAVRRLLYGADGRAPSRKIRATTAATLLALNADLDTLAPGARVNAAGTRRRIQGMCRLGWSLAAQAQQVNCAPVTYTGFTYRDHVTARTARTVRALYAELSMTPATPSHSATTTCRLAQRKGWLPPLAWDDDLIDLPDTELKAEIARRVANMDDDELRRCHNGFYRLGDQSPLIMAGAREWRRRAKARAKARRHEAA